MRTPPLAPPRDARGGRLLSVAGGGCGPRAAATCNPWRLAGGGGAPADGCRPRRATCGSLVAGRGACEPQPLPPRTPPHARRRPSSSAACSSKRRCDPRAPACRRARPHPQRAPAAACDAERDCRPPHAQYGRRTARPRRSTFAGCRAPLHRRQRPAAARGRLLPQRRFTSSAPSPSAARGSRTPASAPCALPPSAGARPCRRLPARGRFAYRFLAASLIARGTFVTARPAL